MIYKIKAKYETGDSFSNSVEESTLELTWTNLDVAKENLKRIKEHYTYYSKIENSYHSKKEDELIRQEMKKQRWYADNYIGCLKLITDEGKELQFSAFWTGYFEKLIWAKIEPEEDTDMQYIVKED